MSSAKNPPLYYDGASGDYWLQVDDRFMRLSKRDLEMHLTVLDPEHFKHHSMKSLPKFDAIRYWAQTERGVDYSGPLSGHGPGAFKTQDGKRILVTGGSIMPAPEKGDPEHLEKFLSELLPDNQALHFLWWLKCAADSLEAGDFRPGQVVVFAGESGCGKSLCQALITEFLGGRVAKPYRYLSGETTFNSDLAAAEHWMLSDEKASLDLRARRNFGEALKESCVVREMSVHAKGREAVTLPTWRRVTLSVNNEPENLSILPPLDSSILDKVFLFQCGMASVPADRKRAWNRLAGDLPALRYQLLKLAIPKARQCPRYGVKAWHHPALVEILSDMSPEQRLLNLIDDVLDLDEPWIGTAVALEKELRGSNLGFAADKLLSWSGACGTYLARLRQQQPNRFDYSRTETKREWRISKG